jgi:hypothetical protein
MASQLINKLPAVIIDHIKLFTGEGYWQNGKYINRIPKNDYRYEILHRRPKIKQVTNGCNKDFPIRGTAWFKLPNNKFMVINVKHELMFNNTFINCFIWELYYNQGCIIHPLR